MPDEINPKTGSVWYAGSYNDIQKICKVLNLGGGRLQTITPDLVYFYMDMTENAIDSMLEECYFTPIRPYSQVMPDGSIKQIFPGGLRRLSQYWTSAMLIQGEFQQLDTNTNETVNSYVDESRREIYRYTLYNQRLPGQVYKSNWSRTLSPTMQPGLPPEQNW